MKTGLVILLGLFGAYFLVVWTTAVVRGRRGQPRRDDPATGSAWPSWPQAAVGFVTSFFDTLGIGSFAPTTSVYKFTRMVPDELIPGTMNVGFTIPVVVQAFIYISIIEVELTTLVLVIASSILGAWLGAGIVAALPRRPIQIGMGLALLTAAVLMAMTQLELFPLGGEKLALTGIALAVAVGGGFVLGALNTIGIGFYGPCMIMISLLAMDPRAAFPIMMGACAFLMPVASARFVRKGKYCLRPAMGLTLAGIPAVLLAALIVKSLPLGVIRWLVVVVVIYAAVTMVLSAMRERRTVSQTVE